MNELIHATWSDLTEPQPEHTKTFLERKGALGFLEESAYDLRSWLDHGVMRLDLSGDEDFMRLVDDYAAFREQLPKDPTSRNNFWRGWQSPMPYLVSPPMLELGLCSQLMQPMAILLNECPLLHLALTGWVSTERNWHQDSYLNPPYVWSSYVAVWIALDDITADSGPFEFVPGSHKWDVLRREKLFRYLDPSIRASAEWPSLTQGEVARVCEEKIQEMGAERVAFIPRKGEVLFWHSNLVHRGTEPMNPLALRKALIMHYSATSKRVDMQPIKKFKFGNFYDGPRG